MNERGGRMDDKYKKEIVVLINDLEKIQNKLNKISINKQRYYYSLSEDYLNNIGIEEDKIEESIDNINGAYDHLQECIDLLYDA